MLQTLIDVAATWGAARVPGTGDTVNIQDLQANAEKKTKEYEKAIATFEVVIQESKGFSEKYVKSTRI